MSNQMYASLAKAAKRQAARTAKRAVALAKRNAKKALVNARSRTAKELRIIMGLKPAKKKGVNSGKK